MSNVYTIPFLPLAYDLETKEILLQLNKSNRALAELKGVAKTIPNEGILLSSLSLQEAKESSEIENIVTTQDELYRVENESYHMINSSAAKEVLQYREATQLGFSLVKNYECLSLNIILDIQSILEGNKAGFREVPGTTLKNVQGQIIYTPPQDRNEIRDLMSNLEKFINEPNLSELDPLIKLAIIHHQFESIHPFYDGNGRTGRIIMVLYLVLSKLLDLPILYLSRYITQHKGEYYSLLQSVRDSSNPEKSWQEWIMFILKGVEVTAKNTIDLVNGIKKLMDEFKHTLKPLFGKAYRHEILNNLFFHPYTKIDHYTKKLEVTRITASKYLDKMVACGLLTKVKDGKTNYYINEKLVSLFVDGSTPLKPENTTQSQS